VGEIVSTDRLIELMWGDRAPRTAAHSVQIYVSGLRKALEPVAGAIVSRAPALAALVLASPAAVAAPIDMPPLTPREEQVVASRGVGAPADSPSARGFGGARDALAKQSAPVPAADRGFDWHALAAGAAGAAALIAEFAFGVPAIGARVRTAR
jgi:hypothetical protein